MESNREQRYEWVYSTVAWRGVKVHTSEIQIMFIVVVQIKQAQLIRFWNLLENRTEKNT